MDWSESEDEKFKSAETAGKEEMIKWNRVWIITKRIYRAEEVGGRGKGRPNGVKGLKYLLSRGSEFPVVKECEEQNKLKGISYGERWRIVNVPVIGGWNGIDGWGWGGGGGLWNWRLFSDTHNNDIKVVSVLYTEATLTLTFLKLTIDGAIDQSGGNVAPFTRERIKI